MEKMKKHSRVAIKIRATDFVKISYPQIVDKMVSASSCWSHFVYDLRAAPSGSSLFYDGLILQKPLVQDGSLMAMIDCQYGVISFGSPCLFPQAVASQGDQVFTVRAVAEG